MRLRRTPIRSDNTRPHLNLVRNAGGQRGVALVITLLMLSVITFLAIAFLAMTARDKSAVTTSLDVDTARSMSDAALARAQAGIIAQMMASNDILSYDYSASHNFINPDGFNAAVGVYNPTNVNYSALGGSTNANWAQNINNLFYDPRPPVFVMTNGNLAAPANDFRYWVDVNRNGAFESNGLVQMLDINGNFILNVSNFYNGEPEWIGVLKYPETNHSASNPFIGRYAFMVLPIGKTLDWNYIHNYSRGKGGFAFVNSEPVDGFVRDEGVGSWELNLAALLNDTSSELYSPYALYPASDVNAYNYNLGGSPPYVAANTGYAFDDAAQFLYYRFAGYPNSGGPASASTYPQPLSYAFSNNAVPTSLGLSDIDEYGAYPMLTAPFDYNQYSITNVPNVNNPWPGSYNTNLFYDVQDLFNPGKTGTANANPIGSFSYRLGNVMASLDSYDRYTFQRLLATIGTSSSPEYGVYVYSNFYSTNITPPGQPNYNPAGYNPLPTPSVLRTKVNINYDNTAQIQAGPYNSAGGYNPMPTNVAPWGSALEFFTNAAESLIRSQIFVYTNFILVNGQYVQAPPPYSFIYTNFDLTNIPVYNAANPGIVYNEQVHRMLQLAANIYAAAYSNTLPVNYVIHPPVFRPLFTVARGAASNVSVTITGFAQVTNDGYAQLTAGGTSPSFYDLTNSAAASVPNNKLNFWGIPWVIGAVKGLPAFDQYSYVDQVSMSRVMQFIRNPDPTNPGSYLVTLPLKCTNQFYQMSLSNVFGMNAWNPYSTPFSSQNGLWVIASNYTTVVFTNNYNSKSILPFVFSTNISTTLLNPGMIWPGWNNAALQRPSVGQFKTIFAQTNLCLPPGYYSDTAFQFITNTINGLNPLPGDTNQTKYPTHYWTATVTNHVVYALFDGNPQFGTASLLDFVNLGPFGSSFPITQYLINHDPNGTWWIATNTTDNGQPDAGNSQLSQGEQNQIKNYAVVGSAFYDDINGLPGGTAASSPVFNFPGGTPESAQLNAPTITPIANYADTNIFMASDPLVHYTIGDLFVPSSTTTPQGAPQYGSSQIISNLPTALALSLGGPTLRYKFGAANGGRGGVMLYGDPSITNSDTWQFPTNLFPTVGWLGRVHRGTPWQTVYLKADSPSQTLGWNNYQTGTMPWVNSFYTYPTNDWQIVDLFTAVPNDNAARGLLSVNQINDPAWAAVFAGVIALTNTTGGIPLNPTNDVYYLMDTNVPGSVGINAARAAQPNQIFHKVGYILQASTLTNNPEGQIGPYTDEMVERIPQQTLGLLKVGLPQFVIYAWGQSLKPKNLYSGGSANLNNICTNYEITGEFQTRTVCHVVSDPGAAAPKIIVDSYNIQPGN